VQKHYISEESGQHVKHLCIQDAKCAPCGSFEPEKVAGLLFRTRPYLHSAELPHT